MSIPFFDTGENRITIDREIYFTITKIIGPIYYRAFQFPEPTRYRSDHQVFCIKPDPGMNGIDGPGIFMYSFFHGITGSILLLGKANGIHFFKLCKTATRNILKKFTEMRGIVEAQLISNFFHGQ